MLLVNSSTVSKEKRSQSFPYNWQCGLSINANAKTAAALTHSLTVIRGRLLTHSVFHSSAVHDTHRTKRLKTIKSFGRCIRLETDDTFLPDPLKNTGGRCQSMENFTKCTERNSLLLYNPCFAGYCREGIATIMTATSWANFHLISVLSLSLHSSVSVPTHFNCLFKGTASH